MKTSLTDSLSFFYRIWESRTWSANNWDVMEGHVQSAVWSPCGTKVIFADSVQSTLYSLSVEPVPPLGEKNPHFLKVTPPHLEKRYQIKSTMSYESQNFLCSRLQINSSDLFKFPYFVWLYRLSSDMAMYVKFLLCLH